MLLFIWITKESSIAVLSLSSVYGILFILRIFKRRVKLKNLDYFNLKEKGYSTDARKRGDQFGDVVSIIIYLVIAISSYDKIGEMFFNSQIELILAISLLYFSAASVSISKNYKLLKVVTILFSTIQGFLFLFVLLSFILIGIISFIEMKGIQIIPSFLTMLSPEFIVALCYLTENYWKETVLMMLASVFLYTIYIYNTPPYQLEELSTAFKIVNLLIIILGIIIYFYANISWTNIQKFIIEIKDTNNLQFLDGVLLDPHFMNYLNDFSKNNIINMGYILFLPYTFGIIVSNLIIESFKKRNNKLAIFHFNSIIEGVGEDDKIEMATYFLHKKQFIFNQGDLRLLKIIDYVNKINFKEK